MTTSTPEAARLSLLDLRDKITHPKEILLPTAEISAHLWPLLIFLTDQQKKEHGLIISKYGNKIFQSKITPGTSENPEGENFWRPPLFPHGTLNSWRYIAGMVDLLAIHTHHMGPDLDHIQTTHHSTGDLDLFARLNFAASLVIDRGGAHLLKVSSLNFNERLQAEELMNRAYKENTHVLGVIKNLAEQFAQHGFQYYYSPRITFSAGEFVEFNDARFLEIPKV